MSMEQDGLKKSGLKKLPVGPKMSKVKSRGKAHHLGRRTIKAYLSVLLILLAAVLFSLLVDYGFVKNPLNLGAREVQTFAIVDECSLIVGQLVHTVGDEDVCEMRCKTECGVKMGEFIESDFEEIENDCNKCSCFCK